MVLVVCVGLVYILFIHLQSLNSNLTSSQAGQAFSDASENYTDRDGNAISLADMVGEPFVVTSWASWCPHCFTELQTVDKVMQDFPDVRVLGINRSESQVQISRYLATQPELVRTELIVDTSDQYFSTIEGYTMPETIVFDQTGQIVYHARGTVNPQALQAAISALLTE